MKVLFIDTETTGLDPKVHSVIQIGAVLAELEGGVLVERSAREWNLPSDGLVWQKGAALVNGWPGRYRDVREEYHHRAIGGMLEMCNWETKDVLLGGHNVGFDIGFLDAMPVCDPFSKVYSHRRVDSQSMAFPLVALGHAKSTSLAEMQRVFGDLFDDPAAQHTALSDARASMRLANHLIRIARPGLAK